MNTENELFGELHEQEENGLFGNEHRRQYEAQDEALCLSAVSGSVCNYCKGKGKIFHWEFGQFVECSICQTDR